MVELFLILAGVFFGLVLLTAIGCFMASADKKFEYLGFPCVVSVIICGFTAVVFLGLSSRLSESTSPKETPQIWGIM